MPNNGQQAKKPGPASVCTSLRDSFCGWEVSRWGEAEQLAASICRDEELHRCPARGFYRGRPRDIKHLCWTDLKYCLRAQEGWASKGPLTQARKTAQSGNNSRQRLHTALSHLVNHAHALQRVEKLDERHAARHRKRCRRKITRRRCLQH